MKNFLNDIDPVIDMEKRTYNGKHIPMEFMSYADLLKAPEVHVVRGSEDSISRLFKYFLDLDVKFNLTEEDNMAIVSYDGSNIRIEYGSTLESIIYREHYNFMGDLLKRANVSPEVNNQLHGLRCELDTLKCFIYGEEVPVHTFPIQFFMGLTEEDFQIPAHTHHLALKFFTTHFKKHPKIFEILRVLKENPCSKDDAYLTFENNSIQYYNTPEASF